MHIKEPTPSGDHFSNKASDLAKKVTLQEAGKVIQQQGWGAMPDFLDNYFRSLNIQPSFIQEKNPDYLQMRNRLKTASGLVISNHPGYFDFPIIVASLGGRKDVKIFVAEKIHEEYSGLLGQEYFLKATKDPTENKKIFRKAQEHLAAGGIILIFPTGTDEHLSNTHREDTVLFQTGFGFLVKHFLKPPDMIYSFHVDENDIASIIDEKIRRGWGAASDTIFPGMVNPNQFKETKIIKVNEVCTNASEWQELIQRDSLETNRQLTAHFKNQF